MKLFPSSRLVDTKLTDETLPILTSTSVDRHAQSQAINKVEGTVSCVMKRRLTQSPTACRYDDCPVTIVQYHYKGQLSTTEFGSIFEHYKNPTKREWKREHCEFYDHSLSLSLSPPLGVSIHSKNLT